MHIAGFLDPLGTLMGLDGIILMAFILGFPANEIVLPIILMAYLQSGVLAPMDDKTAILSLLSANGWTVKTAVCMAIFSLFHWPCSTTCLLYTSGKDTQHRHGKHAHDPGHAPGVLFPQFGAVRPFLPLSRYFI